MDCLSIFGIFPIFPTGILFKDITPLWPKPAAFHEAIRRLQEHYPASSLDAVAAAEARVFFSPRR